MKARRSRRSVYSVIAMLNDPRIAAQKLASGNTLWASVSRPKTERGHGSHASKIRRLLHELQVNFDEVDAVYVTGSVWHKDVLVGSVDKPSNGVHVRKGKLEKSWIDLVALSKTTGVQEEDLTKRWDQIMS